MSKSERNGLGVARNLLLGVVLVAAALLVLGEHFGGVWRSGHNVVIDDALMERGIARCSSYRYLVERGMRREYLVYCSGRHGPAQAYVIDAKRGAVNGPYPVAFGSN